MKKVRQIIICFLCILAMALATTNCIRDDNGNTGPSRRNPSNPQLIERGS